MIAEMSIGSVEIKKLLPSFADRQAQRDVAWMEAFKRAGFASSVEIVHRMDLDRRGELGTSTELSPYFRVGRLRFEASSKPKVSADRIAYLEKVNYPALLMFRDKSAVLNFSRVSHERMSRFVQIYLTQAFCNLEPIVVKCTAIDLQNFGGTFGLLTSAVPNLELLTTTNEVDAFFDKLSHDMRHRNKARGFRYPYLYQYNRAHKESSIPYHFVVVSSFESDLTEKQKEVLSNLIANNNAAKAGIYFLLLFQGEKAFQAIRNSTHSLAAIMEFADGDHSSKLEIIDPAGLNTGEGGGHEHLMVIPDITDEADLDRLATYCLQHLNKKKPDPVRIALPSTEKELWKCDAGDGIIAPIGKAKGSEVMLALGGRAIVHNALVGGAVGTGKTSLLNAIILQCAALYSPDELRISILDYKNGTEFAFYESMPHLYALSLGPGTKFGQDLLGHLQTELQRRAEIFKKVGATNLEAYRSKVDENLPRHLVIIDEFQVLLQDRKRGMECGQMLEDLVRRGRSFGFNFILSTQSLKDGALTPASAANVGCRICLRLSETECCNFLSTDNILPSTFEYTGQAVYNDKEGRREGNTEFRVAYYPDLVLKQFLNLIATLRPTGENHDRYIYHGSEVRTKAAGIIPRPAAHVYLGLEDGIPPTYRFSSLDPGSGPCLVLGRGAAVDAFKANLIDDLNYVLGADGWCEWTAEKLVKAINPTDDMTVADASTGDLSETVAKDPPKAIVLELSLKDAKSISLQNAYTQLINDGQTKVFMFVHTSAILRALYIDRQAVEMSVFCDQRCFAEVSYGTDMIFDENTVALILPGEESHSTINIPQIQDIS